MLGAVQASGGGTSFRSGAVAWGKGSEGRINHDMGNSVVRRKLWLPGRALGDTAFEAPSGRTQPAWWWRMRWSPLLAADVAACVQRFRLRGPGATVCRLSQATGSPGCTVMRTTPLLHPPHHGRHLEVEGKPTELGILAVRYERFKVLPWRPIARGVEGYRPMLDWSSSLPECSSPAAL